jgi:hypothetical protein
MTETTRSPGRPRAYDLTQLRTAVERLQHAGAPVTPEAVTTILRRDHGMTRTPRPENLRDDIATVVKEAAAAETRRQVGALPADCIAGIEAALRNAAPALIAVLAGYGDDLRKAADGPRRLAEEAVLRHDETIAALRADLAAEQEAREVLEARLEAREADLRRLGEEADRLRAENLRLEGRVFSQVELGQLLAAIGATVSSREAGRDGAAA